ncbi:MAG TPA: hypothetical protein VM370_06755 [Candidatus Thermoplasmatota archaeon]|nr:hypothetical protein [Candidatus Thermoplasmatota archaeon]
MRALPLLLAVALLAGCGTPGGPPPTPTPEPDVAQLRLLALDGRWPFDATRADALLAEAHAPAALGALVLGEAMGARVHDYAGLDARAAEALGIALPEPGTAIVAASTGLATGDALALRSHAWPTPYVATYFEMERLTTCEAREAAKLCALPTVRQGEARLRLRVDEGARDGAFLPDLVELGPGARPAYWNGTATAPDGTATPFGAAAPLDGPLTTGAFPETMAAGDWVIAFTLEANGQLATAAAAGIVRVREPGYTWFDDRLQQVEGAAAQARSILANATPTARDLTVARAQAELPLGADIILNLDDARALAGTHGVTALLANLTHADERALDAARGPDGLTLALHPRPLPARVERASEGALVFAAAHDLDITKLPAVEGAGAPALALAGRPGVGEATTMDAAPLARDVLLLAHAEGPTPWALDPSGRWNDTADALDNLSRSRTLALGSPDLVATPFATARIELGHGNVSRTIVGIGGVLGGPSQALWTSAAFIAGQGAPVAPRVIVPLLPGADRAAVLQRAAEAYAPFGVVPDR